MTDLTKHQAGRHDQKSHGSWARAAQPIPPWGDDESQASQEDLRIWAALTKPYEPSRIITHIQEGIDSGLVDPEKGRAWIEEDRAKEEAEHASWQKEAIERYQREWTTFHEREKAVRQVDPAMTSSYMMDLTAAEEKALKEGKARSPTVVAMDESVPDGEFEEDDFLANGEENLYDGAYVNLVSRASEAMLKLPINDTSGQYWAMYGEGGVDFAEEHVGFAGELLHKLASSRSLRPLPDSSDDEGWGGFGRMNGPITRGIAVPTTSQLLSEGASVRTGLGFWAARESEGTEEAVHSLYGTTDKPDQTSIVMVTNGPVRAFQGHGSDEVVTAGEWKVERVEPPTPDRPYHRITVRQQALLYPAILVQGARWEDEVAKHLQGQHDQKSHGRKRGGTAPQDEPAPSKRDEYGGQHAPPETGPPLYDLLEGELFPGDVYDHPEYYVFGEDAIVSETLDAIESVRGKPDATVTIFRAVPPDVDEINPGDWVALSPTYAEQHGQDRHEEIWDPDVEWILGEGTEHEQPRKGMWVEDTRPWRVLSAEVPARTVRNGGNDLIEWGWWPTDEVTKHLPGQHDQASHGSWARLNRYGRRLQESDRAHLASGKAKRSLKFSVLDEPIPGEYNYEVRYRGSVIGVVERDWLPSSEEGGLPDPGWRFGNDVDGALGSGKTRADAVADAYRNFRPKEQAPVADLYPDSLPAKDVWSSFTLRDWPSKPKNSVWPDLRDEVQRSGLLDDVSAHGVQVPIQVFVPKHGTPEVVGGHHRLVAAADTDQQVRIYWYGPGYFAATGKRRSMDPKVYLEQERRSNKRWSQIKKHLPGRHDQKTHGSWAGGRSDELPPVEEPDTDALYARIGELQERRKAEGDTTRYDAEIDRLFNEGRNVKRQWEREIVEAITSGRISPKDAAARWRFNEWDPANPEEGLIGSIGNSVLGSRYWVPLPDTLYHVTTNADAVRESGRLLGRSALDQDRGHGLGGGSSDTVSFTTQRGTATEIRRAMLEAADVASGRKAISEMVEAARTGRDAEQPYLADVMHFYGERDWKDGDPLPEVLSRAMSGDWDGDPVEERLDTFKNFAAMRAMRGGPMDPLFFNSDAQAIAALRSEDVGIVEVHPQPGTYGVRMGGMDEIRLPGWGDGVPIAAVLEKHLPGQHDQKSHGSWAKTHVSWEYREGETVGFPVEDVRVVDQYTSAYGEQVTVYAGQVADLDQPVVGYRGLTSDTEISGAGATWQSTGRATARGEQGTSFSYDPDDGTFGDWAVESEQGEFRGELYRTQVAVDLRGLSFVTLQTPRDGRVWGDRGLGLSITDPIPKGRILAVRTYSPQAEAEMESTRQITQAPYQTLYDDEARRYFGEVATYDSDGKFVPRKVEKADQAERKAEALPTVYDPTVDLVAELWGKSDWQDRNAQAIQGLADLTVPTVAAAWSAEFRRLLTNGALAEALADIDAGHWSMADARLLQSIYNLTPDPVQLTRILEDLLTRGYLQSAQALQAAYPDPKVDLRSSLTRPYAEASTWALQEAGKLIVEITESTRMVVSNLVARSQVEGWPPVTLAAEIRRHVGLHSRYSDAVSNYHRGLVGQGVPAGRAMSLAMQYADRLKTARAMTIARTETIAASNMGQQMLWRQAYANGLLDPRYVRRRWVVTRDDKRCERCTQMGQEERAYAGLFEDFAGVNKIAGQWVEQPVLAPPLHPNCRCSMVLEVLTPAEITAYFGKHAQHDQKSHGSWAARARRLGWVDPDGDFAIPPAGTKNHRGEILYGVESHADAATRLLNGEVRYHRARHRDGTESLSVEWYGEMVPAQVKALGQYLRENPVQALYVEHVVEGQDELYGYEPGFDENAGIISEALGVPAHSYKLESPDFQAQMRLIRDANEDIEFSEDDDLAKHQPGKHDQKSHGTWARGQRMSAEADADPRSWAEGVPTARAQVKTALTNTRQLLEHLSDWTDQVADIGDAWNREHRPWARGLPSGSPGGFTHDKRARIKLGIETMNAMDALSDPEGRKMIEQWLDRPVSSGTRPSVRTNRVDLRQLWFAKNAREAVISYLATKDDGAQQFVEAAEAAGLLVRTKGKRPSQAEEPLPGAPAWDDWIMIDDSSAAETGWAFAPIRLEDASDAIAALPFYPGDDVLGAHQMSRGIVDDWAGSSSGDLDAWITQLASARVGDSSVPMYPTASQLLDIATDQSLPSGGSGEFAGDESLDFYDLDGDLNQAFTNRAMGLDGDEHSFAWKRLLATKMYERTQQWLDDEGFSDSSTFMFFRGAGWEQVTDDGYRHGIQPGAGRRPDLVDYVGPSLIEELGRVGLDPTDEEIDHPDGPGAMALDPGEDVISNPLSSWTASAKIADQFNDFTLITRVPRTALLSTFVTGLGCASEAEFVLRADVLDSLKSNMWLWRNYPDSRF